MEPFEEFAEEEDEGIVTFGDKVKAFFSVHWRGVMCVIVPIILIGILLPFPPKPCQWCGYTLVLMAIFWVSECIPIAITSFFPILIFPLTGVMTTADACKAYINDTVIMFIGSIVLAYSIEQSGLHKRLAYCAIRLIGYSHVRLLLAMNAVTTFVSMWVTNTAAATMMVPINFAVLKVFDDQNLLKIYDIGPDGEKIASDITTCYFCSASYSATIGGIGTLVGTATNLAFKGLFQTSYPLAPEHLSFLSFSSFAIPYMIVLEVLQYLYMVIVYFGVFRPGSKAAQEAKITQAGMDAAAQAILEDSAKMGNFTFWEAMVLLLFSIAILGFFSRSPQIFTGWGDFIAATFGILDSKFVRDSALAIGVAFIMFALPSTMGFFKNFTAQTYEELPKTRIVSVLDWARVNSEMPFGFMFLLGGGFALSDAAKTTGLNEEIGKVLKELKDFPNLMIIFFITVVVIFITNFASNVAVANVICPLVMQLAKETKRNPLWYCIVAGFSASYCYMIPVGTPGNLVVQSAASIPTKKMIIAGLGPTIQAIIVTFLAMSFWAPVIWKELLITPAWAIL